MPSYPQTTDFNGFVTLIIGGVAKSTNHVDGYNPTTHAVGGRLNVSLSLEKSPLEEHLERMYYSGGNKAKTNYDNYIKGLKVTSMLFLAEVAKNLQPPKGITRIYVGSAPEDSIAGRTLTEQGFVFDPEESITVLINNQPIILNAYYIPVNQ